MFKAKSIKEIERVISSNGLYLLYFKQGSYFYAFTNKEAFDKAYKASREI
jgi:hypothetical protein